MYKLWKPIWHVNDDDDGGGGDGGVMVIPLFNSKKNSCFFFLKKFFHFSKALRNYRTHAYTHMPRASAADDDNDVGKLF